MKFAHFLRAYPTADIPARTRHGASIIHMILNNLDPAVAQFPQELVTYGGNGQVFSNWAQVCDSNCKQKGCSLQLLLQWLLIDKWKQKVVFLKIKSPKPLSQPKAQTLMQPDHIGLFIQPDHSRFV